MVECENCHRAIGDLESALRWRTHVVCQQCAKVLPRDARAAPGPRTVITVPRSTTAAPRVSSVEKDNDTVAPCATITAGAEDQIAPKHENGRATHWIVVDPNLYLAASVAAAILYAVGYCVARYDIARTQSLLNSQHYSEGYFQGAAIGGLITGVVLSTVVATLMSIDLRHRGWRMPWIGRLAFCAMIVMPILCPFVVGGAEYGETYRYARANGWSDAAATHAAGVANPLMLCIAAGVIASVTSKIARRFVKNTTPEPPAGRMIAVALLGSIAFVVLGICTLILAVR